MPSFENCEHKLSVFFFNQTSNDIYSLNLTICFQTQNSEYKNPSPLRPGHTVDTVALRSALWRLAAVYTQWPPVYRVLDPAGTSTCTSEPGSPSPPTQTYPRTETRRCTQSPGKQRQYRLLSSRHRTPQLIQWSAWRRVWWSRCRWWSCWGGHRWRWDGPPVVGSRV